MISKCNIDQSLEIKTSSEDNVPSDQPATILHSLAQHWVAFKDTRTTNTTTSTTAFTTTTTYNEMN